FARTAGRPLTGKSSWRAMRRMQCCCARIAWMSELLTDAEIKAAAPPAKRWRNWYAGTPGLTCEMCCTVCGAITYLRPKDRQGSCCRRFPSKDVAETFALKHRGNATYLGAFPAEE